MRAITISDNIILSCGISEAIFVQALFEKMLAVRDINDQSAYMHGRWWVQMSYEEWATEIAPFVSSRKTMIHLIRRLVNRGVVLKKNERHAGVWLPSYYTLDFGVLRHMEREYLETWRKTA